MSEPAAAHKRWLRREAGRPDVDVPVPVLPGEKVYLMQAPVLETYTEGPYDQQHPVVILKHETLPKGAAVRVAIRYRRTGSDDVWQNRTKDDAYDDGVKILELDEATEYEFQTQVITKREARGEWSEATLLTTAKDPYAPAAPDNVQYTGFEPSYGNVSQGKMEWKKPSERDYKVTRVQARYAEGEWPDFEFDASGEIAYPGNLLWWINNSYPDENDSFYIRLSHEDFSGNRSEVFENGPYPLLGRVFGATSETGSTAGVRFGPAFLRRLPPPEDTDPGSDGTDENGSGTGTYVPGPDTAGEPSGNAFLVNENFTEADVPSDAKDLYQTATRIMNDLADKSKAYIARGTTSSHWSGSKIDLYLLRGRRTYLQTAMIMLDATGDARILNTVVSIWNALIAKAETSWNPSGYKDSLKGKGLEKPGIKRFNYYNLERKTFTAFISQGGYTNHHELESDLHSGFCGELRYFLWRNQDYSPAVQSAYRSVCEYHDGIVEQRKLFSKDWNSSKPDYYWGTGLKHATDSRFAEAFYMVKMGHTEWTEQLNAFRGWIAPDIELIDHPDGYQLYNVPHGVQGRKQAQGGNLPYHTNSQDLTYVGDSFSTAELICRVGSDLFTPALLKAMGHTCDMGMFYEGYDSDKVGGGLGGGGPSDGSVVSQFRTRTGLTFPSRYKLPGKDENGKPFREDMYQVTRVMATVPMWRVMNAEMDAGLAKVVNKYSNTGYKVPVITRFLAKIGGRLGA